MAYRFKLVLLEPMILKAECRVAAVGETDLDINHVEVDPDQFRRYARVIELNASGLSGLDEVADEVCYDCALDPVVVREYLQDAINEMDRG
jgi:hypothetical protein